jgi:hypothetical protein
MKSPCALLLSVLGALLLAACNYDTALTPRPTKTIDPRLLGDWVMVDKETGKAEAMQVRQLDKSTYVIALDGDIYSAFHSDFAGTGFLSVQDLNTSARLWVYVTASVSADGNQLTLRTVNTKVVPETTKGRGALQKLIKASLANPALFEAPLVFNRPAAP